MEHQTPPPRAPQTMSRTPLRGGGIVAVCAMTLAMMGVAYGQETQQQCLTGSTNTITCYPGTLTQTSWGCSTTATLPLTDQCTPGGPNNRAPCFSEPPCYSNLNGNTNGSGEVYWKFVCGNGPDYPAVPVMVGYSNIAGTWLTASGIASISPSSTGNGQIVGTPTTPANWMEAWVYTGMGGTVAITFVQCQQLSSAPASGAEQQSRKKQHTRG